MHEPTTRACPGAFVARPPCRDLLASSELAQVENLRYGRSGDLRYVVGRPQSLQQQG